MSQDNPNKDNSPKKDEEEIVPRTEAIDSFSAVAGLSTLLNDPTLSDETRQKIQAVIYNITNYNFGNVSLDPNYLKALDEVIPGAAKTILARVEKQSDHSIELDNFSTKEHYKYIGHGQNYAFIVVIVIALISGFLIWSGHDVSGSVLGVSDLAGLAAIFLNSKNNQSPPYYNDDSGDDV